MTERGGSSSQRANPGRVGAARALLDVERGGRVEDALERHAPAGGIDRGLAWFLALGGLRRRGGVDAALRERLSQPIAALDEEVRVALRLGAFEKLYGRAADHAVVSQWVEVVRVIGGGRASGLVNAVLRRVEPARRPTAAEALDHPAWLVHRWMRRYGPGATEAWCRRDAGEPPLFVVLRDAAAKAGLVAAGLDVVDTDVAGVLRVGGHAGSVTSLPGFVEGQLWVQDLASVKVADLAGDVAGKRVLDACAAPGGKAFRLLSRGAVVTATDREEARLALLRDTAARLGFEPEVAVHDWEAGGVGDRRWDVVLVDAPCTGLGTTRRHPDIRWRRNVDDIGRMAQRQEAIVENALRHVARGGVLVYAVCSPEPEEGPDVVRAVLARHPEWRLDAELSTAPPREDEDAFYGARLVR
jgi:16S rRNA (cytosine967-C5)-methyltransferase